MFNKFKFLIDIFISDIRYKSFKSQNSNLFYLFNNQHNYILAHYFIYLKTIKHNNDKFITYLLIKPTIKYRLFII